MIDIYIVDGAKMELVFIEKAMWCSVVVTHCLVASAELHKSVFLHCLCCLFCNLGLVSSSSSLPLL